jgi:hypothetical protein
MQLSTPSPFELHSATPRYTAETERNLRCSCNKRICQFWKELGVDAPAVSTYAAVMISRVAAIGCIEQALRAQGLSRDEIAARLMTLMVRVAQVQKASTSFQGCAPCDVDKGLDDGPSRVSKSVAE